MQDFIAALLAALGAILVIAGATVTALKPVAAEQPTGFSSETTTPVSGWKKFIRRVDGAERLIVWGIVLLVLASIAAGAISFNFGAAAGSKP
jgi:hypothetical protein